MEVNTYYFDGSDADAVGSNWNNPTNAQDGSTSTYADTTTYNLGSLKIEGTNAPASGGTITSIRARVYGRHYSSFDDVLYIYTDGEDELVLPYLSSGSTPESIDTPGWSSWFSLNTPTGGWTWSKIQALEAIMSYDSGFGGDRDGFIYRIEIEVTTSDNQETIQGLSSMQGVGSITL